MSENDPWKKVGTYAADICLDDGDLIDVDVCLRTEVDAARAAEATQHQQEKDTLRTMATRLTCWRCGTAAYQPNERCDSHMSWTDRLQTEVEHHNAWRKRADEAEAERDRLKAALSTAAFALDLAGFRRDRDAAYAALTPQGQSTDGETR